MANTTQYQVHEQKLEKLVKSMPFYSVDMLTINWIPAPLRSFN